MSWLSKAAKKAVKHTSKGFIGKAFGSSSKTAKMIGGFLDPGGLAVSNLQTGEKPRTIRNALDPGGYFAAPEQTKQTPYTPGQRTLSPAAQKLYDDMLARRAGRATGQPVAPGPVTPVRPVAPAPVAAPMAPPVTAIPPRPAITPYASMSARRTASGGDPYVIGGGRPSLGGAGRPPFADGGQVCSDEHLKLTNKVTHLKRNGKPY